MRNMASRRWCSFRGSLSIPANRSAYEAAVKDKLSDMNTMRKAKAEAKAEEKAEKELAKARVEVAKEVRKAKEAEAAMDLHVAKAEQKAKDEVAKIAQEQS